jgi:hypothetical protein
MRTRTVVASTILVALTGCASCDSVPSSAVTDCSAQVVPGGAAVDLLVVIDDSGSMTDKQLALADNLSDFIDALTSSAISLDVRIGVTNTSIDDYGGAVKYGAPDPGGLPYPGPRGAPFPFGTMVAIEQDPSGVGTAGHFLWGTAYATDPANLTSTWGGPRILASGPNLARDFKANVHQGDWGSGKEQPLRATRASLDATMVTSGLNFGFLRSGARLGVIILTDEDDCSESEATKHITSDTVCHSTAIDSPYFDSLDGFVSYLDTTIRGATDGEPPIVAVISGFGTGTDPTGCTSTAFSSYANPRRLGAFLDRLDAAHGGRTYPFSICQPFGDALAAIAQALIPQTMPLQQAPADYRMMVVSVQRGATSVPCHMESSTASASAVSAADVIYRSAPPGGLASLSFQKACKLLPGDKVNIEILCAH